jgi:hypothetical protein
MENINKKNENDEIVVYPLRLRCDEYIALRARAREQDLSGAQFIRRAIRRALKQGSDAQE